MRYKVGDFVKVLVARDCALEGDTGVIDAIHSDNGSYTVGFYAAEDCMVGSARFYEEELIPYEKKHVHTAFEQGDRVKTLIDIEHIQKGSIGEVTAIYEEKDVAIVAFPNENGGYPTIFPYPFTSLELVEKHHH